MVKLATMEAESGSSENWTIFWTLLNNVLKQYTNDYSYRVNPHGSLLGKGGGMFDALGKDFGKGAIETKSVSREKN